MGELKSSTFGFSTFLEELRLCLSKFRRLLYGKEWEFGSLG